MSDFMDKLEQVLNQVLTEASLREKSKRRLRDLTPDECALWAEWTARHKAIIAEAKRLEAAHNKLDEEKEVFWKQMHEEFPDADSFNVSNNVLSEWV